MPDWNEVYAAKGVADSSPAEVLKNNLHLLVGSGEALDYACGMAGNARLLAESGYSVTAWDGSDVAVQKINKFSQSEGLNIHAENIDLEDSNLDFSRSFDVIVVSYFLYRDRLRDLYELLNQGGLLFYQTFSGEQLNGVGPSREVFRLRRGELLEVFSDMQLIYYREDIPVASSSTCVPDQVSFVAKK